jgi:purine-binding chemotaxis protein CheW
MSTSFLVENSSTLAGKYLSFVLAGGEYALPIRTVREIVAMVPITPVPCMPEHILGVINLRGRVIPITDLRARFGLMSADEAPSIIIIVEMEDTVVGLAADRVSEVLQVPMEEIVPPPTFGTDVDTRSLLGLAKMDGRIRLLLDIAHVLGDTELRPKTAVTAA